MYTRYSYSPSLGRTYVYDNKYYKNLGAVIKNAKRKKHQIEHEVEEHTLDPLDKYLVAEDPFLGPGKNQKLTLFKEIRNVKPDTMKLIVNWSGKEFLRETWTRFMEDSFPIVNDQEVMDVFLVINMRPTRPNRCYRFLAQHALRCDPDYVPHEVIRIVEPSYVGNNNEYRISLAKRGGGCPVMNLHAEYTHSFEDFINKVIWENFYKPIVYVGTDSAEEEEILLEVSLVFKIKEFAPDAPLYTGPAY
ncbi:polyhedrin [Artaxa digramma nucleopolyhedrovirus]|uniref:Polyhedrin n=2 Tax=Alphabaculovirus TaxID=558016 RepID=A0AAE6R654_9ABAC|nr:polyhedrin [Euproctis digramma nucleopolyhedrovirus]QHB21660.1 polyhedrin [Artaxa digramma nucleopolyhedrovirus]